MLKNKISLEHTIGKNLYEFTCTPESPLGEIHDSICVFKAYIVDLINEHEKKRVEEEKNQQQEEPQHKGE